MSALRNIIRQVNPAFFTRAEREVIAKILAGAIGLPVSDVERISQMFEFGERFAADAIKKAVQQIIEPAELAEKQMSLLDMKPRSEAEVMQEQLDFIRRIDDIDRRSVKFEEFCFEYGLEILDAAGVYGVKLHSDVNTREWNKRKAAARVKKANRAYYPKFAAAMTLPHSQPPLTQKLKMGKPVFDKNGAPVMVEVGRIDRRDGNHYLEIISKREDVGIAFGPYARLVIAYIFSEYVKTRDPVIKFGKTKTELCKYFGKPHKGDYADNLIEQIIRVANTLFTLEVRQKDGDLNTLVFKEMSFGELFASWRDPQEMQEKYREFIGCMELSQKAMDYINAGNFIPFDLAKYASLTRSPLAMDYFMLLHQRAFKVDKQGRPAEIPWLDLYEQLGTGISDIHDFMKRSRTAIKSAIKVYDGAPVLIDTTGSSKLVLRPSKKLKLIGK